MNYRIHVYPIDESDDKIILNINQLQGNVKVFINECQNDDSKQCKNIFKPDDFKDGSSEPDFKYESTFLPSSLESKSKEGELSFTPKCEKIDSDGFCVFIIGVFGTQAGTNSYQLMMRRFESDIIVV